MATLVAQIIDDAANAIGDPGLTRVKETTWLLFYNQSVRAVCERADVYQCRSIFNLGAQAAYPYPNELTAVGRVEVNETPDDVDTWGRLGEKFEDEFTALTSPLYPTNTVPEFYFADRLGFYLIPRPTAIITGGGRLTYFGVASRIFEVSGQEFPLRAIAEDYVINLMVIKAKMARNRVVEARAEREQWEIDVGKLKDRLEDPSDDRRSSLRPRRNAYQGMR